MCWSYWRINHQKAQNKAIHGLNVRKKQAKTPAALARPRADSGGLSDAEGRGGESGWACFLPGIGRPAPAPALQAEPS